MDLTFGFGATPNKGPVEAPAEEAPAEETPEETPADDEVPDDEPAEGEVAEQAEAENNDSGTAPETSKWTSNIKSWFGAWKDGKQVDARELDALASVNANGSIMQGQLWKRGVRANDAFHARWVTVDKQEVSYAVDKGTPVIDRIAFEDIVAVCYHKVGSTEGEGAISDAKNVVTTMQHHDEVAGDKRAAVQVESVQDHTKEYEEAASLKVNIIFRDEMKKEAMLAELSHVKDLTLKSTDFALVTAKESYQRGRIFVFRAESREMAEAWSETVSRVLALFQNVPIAKVGMMACLRRLGAPVLRRWPAPDALLEPLYGLCVGS